MTKKVIVRVSTMDSEMTLKIQSDTTGRQLFNQVVRIIGLRETWYFGLQYTDMSGEPFWLDPNQTVLSHDVKQESPIQFRLLVKYYPEDVTELLQEITVDMFYLQVKEAVLAGKYSCSPESLTETAVLLASYATQAKFGDYDPEVHKAGFLEDENVLSDKVKCKLDPQPWENLIVTSYAEHKGMTRDDAKLKYLNISQGLKNYGTHYFQYSDTKDSIGSRRSKGTGVFSLRLGINAHGISTYREGAKLDPENEENDWDEVMRLQWKEIKDLTYTDQQVDLQLEDDIDTTFIFYLKDAKISKSIHELYLGTREMHFRRDKEASIEVQQMNEQVKEQKAAKEAERLNREKERQALEDAEKQQKELEEMLKQAEKELEIAKQEALLMNERMEEAEKELEEAQRRADEARQEAEAAAANLETSNREQKETEAEEEKQRKAVERKKEMEKLQAELNAAKLQIKDLQRSLVEALLPQDLTDETSHDQMEDEDSFDSEEYDRIAQVLKDELMQKLLKDLIDEVETENEETKSLKDVIDEVQTKDQKNGRLRDLIDEFETEDEDKESNRYFSVWM